MPPDRDAGGGGERPAHGGLVSVARGAAHAEQVGELAALVVVADQADRPGGGEPAGAGGVVVPLPGCLPGRLPGGLDEEPDAGGAPGELPARQEAAHDAPAWARHSAASWKSSPASRAHSASSARSPTISPMYGG